MGKMDKKSDRPDFFAKGGSTKMFGKGHTGKAPSGVSGKQSQEGGDGDGPDVNDAEGYGKGFEFVDAVVGGAIPRQFIPSVEQGVRNTLPEGLLAGCPLVDLTVTVYAGSSHAVDSSDMSFQIAASMGLKACLEKARPIVLEPILSVEVGCPSDCMGEVIGDLNSRRGKVLGVEAKGHNEVIRALVPMAELLKYAPDLRSMTSGRGSFESRFDHYEEAPPNVTERIIKDYAAARENRTRGTH